jgi:bifunctional non-homologous end joining protein LigD
MPYQKYPKIEGGKKLTSFITPMGAELSKEPPFDDPAWIFEVKWDGFRAIAELQGKDTRLYSRNGLSFHKAYPKVYSALTQIKDQAVIDGEVVVFNEAGKPDFQSIQNYSSRKNLAIQFYVFDCLKLAGKDLTRLPLLERKKLLQDFLPQSDIIRYCDHIEGDGVMLFEHAKAMNIEGIIAKRCDSKYYPGKRSNEWLKIKNLNTDDFLIVGYTDPKGGREYFGALLLATERKGKLTFAGEVGTGFTSKLLKELYQKIAPQERKSSPLDVPVKKETDWHWVDPLYSAQVNYTEITEEGTLRHPSFQGLRIDK